MTEIINGLKKYLQLNFCELRQNALKEQQLVKKVDLDQRQTKRESIVVSNMKQMVIVEFEQGCVMRGFHLILNERY